MPDPSIHPAETALLRAEAAQIQGDVKAARDWLDRACRLAPQDRAIALARQLHRLRQDHSRDCSDEIAAMLAELAELLEPNLPCEEAAPAWVATSALPPLKGGTVNDTSRPVAIIIPVYRNRPLTIACLRAVFATAPEASIIVVDDASPEPALSRDLDRLAAAGRITLIRHTRNQGFPIAANAGMRAALALETVHDVVLLNADAEVPRGRAPSWLARLRAAVHADRRIGSATPFANNASILSYPARDGENATPSGRVLARFDRLAARANAGVTAEIPTGVGFCLYLRHEMLREIGLFREDAFGLGYGEENDLCRRAAALGWRHVGCASVFVAHHGAASFGATQTRMLTRNLRVLEALHPGYRALVTGWAGVVPAQDSLAPFRRQLDEARWRSAKQGAVLIITHASGGGVERSVQARAAEIAELGQSAILLRPIPVPGDTDGAHLPGLCRVEDASQPEAFPNLVYRLPDEFPAFLRLLRRKKPVAVEIHHRLGHAPEIAELSRRLKLPLDLTLHDYASFCPRVTLLGPEGRYCGEPAEIATCEACIATAGARNGETISVADLRRRSAREFALARHISVPSPDMARRMRRHFPEILPRIASPEDDSTIAAPPAPGRSDPLIVAVIGALGVDKGLDVLRACAEDAARRNLPLYFRVIGHTQNDDALHDTGHAFVTGRYQENEAEALVRAQGAHIAFLPSLWPETWCYTLSIAWRAGLRSVVFDIGAQAERVRKTGYGHCLPLGLSAEMINNALRDCVNP